MGTLEVDTFAGSIGRDQDSNFLVLLEAFLNLSAFIPKHPAVDRYHRFLIAKERADLIVQIAQSIPMLGEDDQFLPLTVRGKHAFVVLKKF